MMRKCAGEDKALGLRGRGKKVLRERVGLAFAQFRGREGYGYAVENVGGGAAIGGGIEGSRAV